MMDGDKIRERLEQMRRAEAAKSAAPAPAAAAPAAPAAPTAPDAPAAAAAPAADRHARIVMGSSPAAGPSVSTLRKYLYLSLAVNVILALVICLLLFLRTMG
jgi:hypothetical protein